jgi:hypothetical protein
MQFLKPADVEHLWAVKDSQHPVPIFASKPGEFWPFASIYFTCRTTTTPQLQYWRVRPALRGDAVTAMPVLSCSIAHLFLPAPSE